MQDPAQAYGHPWSRLRALEPFFAVSAGDAQERDGSPLRSLPALRQFLWRRDRQITFLGTFKAGKSSLVNALLGTALLPVKGGRGRGAVTVIRHGWPPTAGIVRDDAQGLSEEEIPFDAAAAAILGASASSGNGTGSDIGEVRIRAPVPLVGEHWVLVDTPGLADQEALTERSERQLQRSDLAVVVLSADKILSRQERDMARRVHELLNGNLVYVVNRMDLVEDDEREEVLSWAVAALQGSGNRLVGKPRVFATSAKTGQGLTDFRTWLETVLGSPLGERIAVLSRLGLLEERLLHIAADLRAELTAAQRMTELVREEEAAAMEREREAIRRQIAEGRIRLQRCKDQLGVLAESFVAACVEEARGALQARTAPGTIRIPWRSAATRYAAGVSEAVQSAVLGLPVTVPAFDLSGWIVRGEVEAATHPASEVGVMLGDLATRVFDGGSAGREAGASIGGWIGKNVFGVDVQEETLKRIAHLAGGTASSLRVEAERYVGSVDGLLAEADRFYAGWTRTSPRVTAAEGRERYYTALLRWSDGFLEEVRSIGREIEGEVPATTSR